MPRGPQTMPQQTPAAPPGYAWPRAHTTSGSTIAPSPCAMQGGTDAPGISGAFSLPSRAVFQCRALGQVFISSHTLQ